MTIRDKINEVLHEVDPNVYYGMIPENMNIEVWDYLVFGKQKTKKASGGQDMVDYYVVTIVRENYIPDDTVIDVIEKMTSIAGVRLADGEFEYDYTTKGNTDLVVEILPLYFTRPLKGVLTNCRA